MFSQWQSADTLRSVSGNLHVATYNIFFFKNLVKVDVLTSFQVDFTNWADVLAETDDFFLSKNGKKVSETKCDKSPAFNA